MSDSFREGVLDYGWNPPPKKSMEPKPATLAPQIDELGRQAYVELMVSLESKAIGKLKSRFNQGSRVSMREASEFVDEFQKAREEINEIRRRLGVDPY